MAYKDSNYFKNYYLKNKERKNLLSKRWYLKNKEKHLESTKKWRLENKDRANITYKKWYLKNKEKIKKKSKRWYLKNKERMQFLSKRWYLKNKEKHNARNKLWRINNQRRMQFLYKRWYLKNKEKHSKRSMLRAKERRKNDPNFKLANNLRKRILETVKKGYKSASTMKLLGVNNVEEVWVHLEKSFKSGMTRKNHGKWHIDHIIPCSSFDLTKAKQQRKCFHYSNLQALWAHENLSKGNRIL